MRRRLLYLLALSAPALILSGCSAREDPQPQSDFRPTATVKDIMVSIIDPEADVLWNSVATIVSLTGTEERAPRTDEEWATVRRSAIQLVEATNLLRIPGRLVARHGEKSENPRIELEPETIQKLIAEDPATWSKLVNQLHDAAVPALRAIDAKNAAGLFDAGEHMEHACEACHQQYWYPPAHAPAWKKETPTFDRESTALGANANPAGAGDKGWRHQGSHSSERKGAGQSGHQDGDGSDVPTLNAGKRPIQEIVAATADGSLANVFVSLQGSFPATPVPAEPVTIDQRACVYVPRVVGARVGQTLQVRNSDELLHNVHGVSAQGNDFNVSQPKAGIVRELPLKNPEMMLRVTCDVHRWMTAFVGVVSHPYFATTGGAGTYTIDNVPAGTHTIQAWHEQFGVVTQTVRVTAGATSTC